MKNNLNKSTQIYKIKKNFHWIQIDGTEKGEPKSLQDELQKLKIQKRSMKISGFQRNFKKLRVNWKELEIIQDKLIENHDKSEINCKKLKNPKYFIDFSI